MITISRLFLLLSLALSMLIIDSNVDASTNVISDQCSISTLTSNHSLSDTSSKDLSYNDGVAPIGNTSVPKSDSINSTLFSSSSDTDVILVNVDDIASNYDLEESETQDKEFYSIKLARVASCFLLTLSGFVPAQ